MKTYRRSIVVGLSMLVLVAIGFTAMRTVAPRPLVGAQSTPIPTASGDGRCTTYNLPGDEPYTTCFRGDPPEEFWYLPLLVADAARPRFEGTINGILVGQSVVTGATYCDARGFGSVSDRVFAEPERAVGSAVEISPDYLPPETTVGIADALQCGETIYYVSQTYFVKPDLSIPRWGGRLTIQRTLSDPAVGVSGPEERFRAENVAGHPSVILEPLTEEGFGPSAIAIWDGDVLTVVHASGLPLTELLRVAASLY